MCLISILYTVKCSSILLLCNCQHEDTNQDPASDKTLRTKNKRPGRTKATKPFHNDSRQRANMNIEEKLAEALRLMDDVMPAIRNGGAVAAVSTIAQEAKTVALPQCPADKTKDLQSALDRVQSSECWQEMLNIACLNEQKKLYPMSLPRYCPVKREFFYHFSQINTMTEPVYVIVLRQNCFADFAYSNHPVFRCVCLSICVCVDVYHFP